MSGRLQKGKTTEIERVRERREGVNLKRSRWRERGRASPRKGKDERVERRGAKTRTPTRSVVPRERLALPRVLHREDWRLHRSVWRRTRVHLENVELSTRAAADVVSSGFEINRIDYCLGSWSRRARCRESRIAFWFKNYDGIYISVRRDTEELQKTGLMYYKYMNVRI